MESERGLERFLTFVDAAVAIALTLLTLPLVDEANDLGSASELNGFVGDNLTLLLSVLLSFVVIARLWRVHHRLFQTVRQSDGLLYAFTLFWLLTVILIPVPTRLIADYGSESTAIGMYIGLLLLNSAALSVLTRHVDRHTELRVPDVKPVDLVGSLVSTGLLLAATLVGVLVPSIGLYALLFLFLSKPADVVILRAGARRRRGK